MKRPAAAYTFLMEEGIRNVKCFEQTWRELCQSVQAWIVLQMIVIKGTWENCIYFLNHLTWFLCRGTDSQLVSLAILKRGVPAGNSWSEMKLLYLRTDLSAFRYPAVMLMANKIWILGAKVTVNSWWSPLLLSSFCEDDLKWVGSSTSMLWARLTNS